MCYYGTKYIAIGVVVLLAPLTILKVTLSALGFYLQLIKQIRVLIKTMEKFPIIYEN